MADDSRVAVYIDFDNVVISRYDDVHGSGTWRKHDARDHQGRTDTEDEIARNLAEAEVDLGAIIDYASSFGTVAWSRAYADWSTPANQGYKRQLVDRAIDMVQLFNTSGTKNGADIRLAVDAVADLYNHPDITDVVIVAGDSDYIPLAQRCKQLGRQVVAVGVAGSTSRALKAACDEFADYDSLPGVKRPERRRPAKKTAKKAATDPAAEAGQLMARAIRLSKTKDDDGWLYSSSVKSQMQRMDSSFNEKSLGFSSFRAFVESRTDEVETKLVDQQLRVRLK